MVMQPPVKFVLMPSTSLGNDSEPADHSVRSPMILNIPNGKGINIPSPISVLKQSPPAAQSVKGGARNGTTEHIGAAQNSQVRVLTELIIRSCDYLIEINFGLHSY